MNEDRGFVGLPSNEEQTQRIGLAGLANWASVSDEAEARISQQASSGSSPLRQKAVDWTTGDKIWLLDAIARSRGITSMVLAYPRKAIQHNGHSICCAAGRSDHSNEHEEDSRFGVAMNISMLSDILSRAYRSLSLKYLSLILFVALSIVIPSGSVSADSVRSYYQNIKSICSTVIINTSDTFISPDDYRAIESQLNIGLRNLAKRSALNYYFDAGNQCPSRGQDPSALLLNYVLALKSIPGAEWIAVSIIVETYSILNGDKREREFLPEIGFCRSSTAIRECIVQNIIQFSERTIIAALIRSQQLINGVK